MLRGYGPGKRLGDLIELAGGYVEDEAADRLLVRDERAGQDARLGLPDVFVQVSEGLGCPLRLDPGVFLDRALERVVGERQHAAVGVVDENDLGRAEQP